MTHLGNWQGLVEKLSYPEKAETGVCLSFPEVTILNTGEEKHHKFVSNYKRKTVDQRNSLILTSYRHLHCLGTPVQVKQNSNN